MGKTLITPIAARVNEHGTQHWILILPTRKPLTHFPYVSAGMSNREIADALGVAEGTVKNHTSSIPSKLGVRDRTRAVLKALERGDL